jgi:hypothetical protein
MGKFMDTMGGKAAGVDLRTNGHGCAADPFAPEPPDPPPPQAPRATLVAAQAARLSLYGSALCGAIQLDESLRDFAAAQLTAQRPQRPPPAATRRTPTTCAARCGRRTTS